MTIDIAWLLVLAATLTHLLARRMSRAIPPVRKGSAFPIRVSPVTTSADVAKILRRRAR